MKKIYNLSFTHLVMLFNFIFFMSISQTTYATHAQGADLTYECLGGNQYRIKVAFYRDCSGVAAPNTVTVNMNSATCGINQNIVLQRLQPTGQEVTPICPSMNSVCTGGAFPGVQEYIYTTVINLPAACVDWNFSYQVCCRNNAITTIQNPGGEQLYVQSMINNLNYPCNSSPQFSNPPVPFVCVGQPYCFNHGATDVDGDSLAYELVVPQTGPNTFVTYLNPYSATSPLASNPGITVDPITGDICMSPTMQQVTVLAIRVHEYRNGVLIGSVTRDIQIRTINCTNSNPILSGINGTNVFTTTACAGSPVTFQVFSFDPDEGQIVTLNWNAGIQGATFTSAGTPHPVGTFTWTPTAAQVSSVPYCFTVTVADNNCPMNGTQTFAYCITVTGMNATVATTIANCGASNGTATATVQNGVGPFTYNWSAGNNSQNSHICNGLPVGSYTVTISNADGCSITVPFSITGSQAPGNINITSNNVACNGMSTGSATVNANGGQPPYTYQWSNGANTQTINGISAGWYYVTVTTAQGCPKADSVFITQPATTLTGSVSSVTQPLCFGQSNGVISVQANGGTSPYSYSWPGNPGFNQPTQGGLAAGNYQIIITDANGCMAEISTTLNQPQQLSLSSIGGVIQHVSCAGAMDGGASVQATGGTGVITVAWNTVPMQPGNTLSNVGQGVYTAIATDANGCTAQTQVNINEPMPLTLVGFSNPVSCNGGSNGQVWLNPAGGTPPYMYQWTSMGVGNVSYVPNVAAGTYQATVTDANGCTATVSTVVVQPSAIQVTIQGEDTICYGNNATLQSTVSGGTGNYVYQWSTGHQSAHVQVSPLVQTSYSVTVYDANGCSAISNPVTLWVSNINDANINLFGGNAVCPGEFTTISAEVSGGIGTYYLNWNNNLGMGVGPFTFAPAQDDWYVLTVVDECMNEIKDSILVVVHDLPEAELIPHTISGCGPVSVAFQNNTGTVPGTSYFWDFGNGEMAAGEAPFHTYTESGMYLVELTVTSPQGCQSITEAFYDIQSFPVAKAKFTAQQAASEFYPVFQFTNLSTFASTYEWNFGDGNTSVQVHPIHRYEGVGQYQVELIANNMHNCPDTAHMMVTVNPEFTFYVPNAFTPDGDGINDAFFGVGTNVVEVQMLVYDRWGELIFESDSHNAQWDGTYQGSDAKEDVYVYRFKIRDIHGSLHLLDGHVTLLK